MQVNSTPPGKGSWLCYGGEAPLCFHSPPWTALTSSLKSTSITRETRLYNLYNLFLTDLKAWSRKPQTQMFTQFHLLLKPATLQVIQDSF